MQPSPAQAKKKKKRGPSSAPGNRRRKSEKKEKQKADPMRKSPKRLLHISLQSLQRKKNETLLPKKKKKKGKGSTRPEEVQPHPTYKNKWTVQTLEPLPKRGRRLTT